jgi:hypothetical protein
VKLFKTIFLFAILALIAACASDLKVQSEYSKATNFNDFKYYRWHQGAPATGAVVNDTNNKIGGNGQQASELLDQNIRFLIDQQLAARGMVKQEQGPVDFMVDYSIGVAKKIDLNKQLVQEHYAKDFRTYNGFGYAGRYYTGVAANVGSRTTEELTIDLYREGTMMLDFIEPDENKLIWRAIADKRLDSSALPSKERDQLLEKVVKELLAKFPPE